MIPKLNRKFYLDTKRDSGEAPLYFRFRRAIPGTNKKLDKVINTQVIVDVDYWLNSYEKDIAASIVPEQAQFIYDQLKKVCDAFDEVEGREQFDKESVDAIISECVEHKSYADLLREREQARKEEEKLKAVAEEEHKKKEVEEAKKADVLKYIASRIERMESGQALTKGEIYSLGTIGIWRGFYRVLKNFVGNQKLTWQDVDDQLVSRFIAYLRENGYMRKTIAKMVITFRAAVGFSLDEGMHENYKALRVFKLGEVRKEDKAKEIYLTETELQALYEMELTGVEDRARDVFLCGCYTCQRFSDYSKLEPENFGVTDKGTKVVRLTQQKTKTPVTIPILNDNLLHIAEKYNYNIPKIEIAQLNIKIRAILKRLSESVPSLKKEERTILTMKERAKEERGEVSYKRDAKGYVVKPRYELVGSHTARRSGITNLYLEKKYDTIELRNISGHKSERVFLEYVKLSSDEIADEIAKKSVSDKSNKDVER